MRCKVHGLILLARHIGKSLKTLPTNSPEKSGWDMFFFVWKMVTKGKFDAKQSCILDSHVLRLDEIS